MSRNYKFRNPDGAYFVSFSVVYWLDVFTRDQYRKVLLESLAHCQKHKGMEIYAWCIMTNHVHLAFRSIGKERPEQLLGDFKRFTSNRLVKCIRENPKESRKEFLLSKFREAGKKSSNVKYNQFWNHDNHPIEIWSNWVISQKIRYIHNNPVVAGMVFRPEDYPYSSAVDYSGRQGLLEGVVIVSI